MVENQPVTNTPADRIIPRAMGFLADFPMAADPANLSQPAFLRALLSYVFNDARTGPARFVTDEMVERARSVMLQSQAQGAIALTTHPAFLGRLLFFSLTGRCFEDEAAVKPAALH